MKYGMPTLIETNSIENCNGYKDFTMEGIEILLESNVFALTFDIGHNHSINQIDEPFIKNHIALGTGEIDIKEKLNIAKEHNCTCVLETKTIAGLKESVENLKGYKLKVI